MPSPIGHALAGVTVALLSRRFAPFHGSRFWVGSGFGFVAVCAVAAALADADFLLPLRHRGPSHSIGAAALAGLAAYAWWKLAQPRDDAGRVALVIALAYGTHVLCDWLGADSSAPRGLMALWPFSHEYFISDVDLFDSVDRRYWLDGFWRRNTIAVARELAILGPLTALAWWWWRRPPASGVRSRFSRR
jgi:inner membrane protein